MKIQELMEGRTKCGIMNAIERYRPDLYPYALTIQPNKQAESVRFLKQHGLWSDQAEQLYSKMHQAWVEWNQQGDEDALRDFNRAMPDLMALVARIIKKSSTRTQNQNSG